jgi:hypothetical protein
MSAHSNPPRPGEKDLLLLAAQWLRKLCAKKTPGQNFLIFDQDGGHFFATTLPKRVAIYAQRDARGNGIISLMFERRHAQGMARFKPTVFAVTDILQIQEWVRYICHEDELVVVASQDTRDCILPYLNQVNLYEVIFSEEAFSHLLEKYHPGPQKRLHMASFLLDCFHCERPVPKADRLPHRAN